MNSQIESNKSCLPWTKPTRPTKPCSTSSTASKDTPKRALAIFRKSRAWPPATGLSKNPNCSRPRRRNHHQPFRNRVLMTSTLVLVLSMAIAASPFAAAATPTTVLFSESFDDAGLTNRNWYDGTDFRIVGDSWIGQGCIEYEWLSPDTQASGSSGVRRLFEPTEEVCLRFYLKLSKDWGWTGRDYH